jgi:acyl-CoA synthetase (AMP-forming)/AMP-acid ligase II
MAGPRRNWIVDALRRNVETHPHWPVYRYLDAQGNVADCITCYGAFATAQSVARFLTTTCGLKPGDRVVLVYPPGACPPVQAPPSRSPATASCLCTRQASSCPVGGF